MLGDSQVEVIIGYVYSSCRVCSSPPDYGQCHVTYQQQNRKPQPYLIQRLFREVDPSHVEAGLPIARSTKVRRWAASLRARSNTS